MRETIGFVVFIVYSFPGLYPPQKRLTAYLIFNIKSTGMSVALSHQSHPAAHGVQTNHL